MTSRPSFDTPFESPLDTLLERFIDGDLAGEELAWMEGRLAQDPVLRDQIDLQTRVDDSLRRTCSMNAIVMPVIPAGGASASPGAGEAAVAQPALKLAGTPADHSPALPASQGPAPARASLPWKRWGGLAAAAAILLTFAGLFRAYWDARVPDFRLLEPAPMYQQLVSAGFQPAVVCKTEPEFARLVREKLGSALVAVATPGVEVLGWGYQDDYKGSPISPHTMMLLARVDGREVLVLLDRASRDRDLSLPEGSGLRLFRREVGPIVAYEVTPLAGERVINTLELR